MRQPPDRVNPLAALAAEPWRHDFYEALRRIDAHFADRPRLGTAQRPVDEPVRLGQSAELAFAPTALAGVAPANAHRPPRLDVRFFGLWGSNGPLPLHLTDYARQRALHDGDETLARFADVFHHRMLLLFYRAWAQAQPTASLDRPADDRFSELVGALIGIGEATQRGRDAAPDAAKLYFAGHLANPTRHADGLAALLGGYLGKPVRVEQFVGCWLPLAPAERTRLTRDARGQRMPTSRLGGGAVTGGAVWDRQHNIRLHIGPLAADEFEALLPDRPALAALASLVRHYCSEELGWDLALELEGQQVPVARLGRGGRLGWTSWIGRAPHRANTRLIVKPQAALAAARRAAAASAAPISAS